MIEGRLSRRYAKALFELALEERREDEVGQEIDRFLTAYSGSSLPAVLNNPAFPLGSRKNIIIEVSRGLQLSPLAVHFLSLLLERDRLSYLPSVASRYRRLLDEKKGRVEAVVVAPDPLAAATLARMREALGKVSGKEVVLQQESDPGLIGGVVIQLEGKVYDGSVRTQIEKMRARAERGY
ncbi:MAG: ATP synthase F1 subunit delta [Candidatus Binatota bacterium]